MKKEQVLIVEDDADIREGVRILLESENYVVHEAENGTKGLEILDENTDLVILDVMMPGMSGLRTCEEIRKISNVPILFLTAKAQESDKLIGLMAGGDDYLTKPFSYAELLGRVKALVRRYRTYMGKYAPEPLGDYYAGPNHVLPTSGTARFFSPLSVNSFEKRSSFIYYTEDALREAKDDIMLIAKREGLTAHANSIKVRF